MRGGDDRAASDEPAAPLDADAAGGADDADDGSLRGADAPVVRDRERQRPARRRRSRDRRQRVDARKEVQEALRRHVLVEAAEDRRSLSLAAERRLAGKEERGGAEHPDED